MKLKILNITFFLILIISSYSSAQISYFHTQTMSSRPISMAFSYTAVQDFHSSLSYNPAAMILAKDRSKIKDKDLFKINFDLISLGLAIITASFQCDEEDYEDDCEDSSLAYLKLLLYSIRGFTFIDENNLLVSINLHEDLLDQKSQVLKVFDNSYQSAYIAYQLGREFAVGISFSYYQIFKEKRRSNGLGSNLGLQYNSLNFPGLTYGLTYFKFQDKIRNVRSQVERIFDNSLTIGLSYNYQNFMRFSLDLKNINQFHKQYFFEPHIGFEQTIFKNFNIREGVYFKNSLLKQYVYSLGLGYRTPQFENLNDHYLDIGFGFQIENSQNINPSREFLLTIRTGI